MAFWFVDCLTKNRSRFVQILVKIVELLLLSVGFIYTFVRLKVALLLLPYSRCYEIVFSILVGIWTCIRTFFCSPLSICIFIHVTVALIAASSILCRLQTHNHDDDDDDITVYVHQHAVLIAESLTAPPPPAAPPPPPSLPRDIFEFTPPPPSPPTAEPTPSPLLSHSANHSSPDSPDEREREEEDTMEATWMAITGRLNQKPKKKHLKTSETWEPPLRRSTVVQRVDSEEVVPTTPKWKELRKAETFSDAVSIVRRGGLRRDPSMSLEEFNQQVENFIKKFKDSMRLQRQESNYRFLQMINRRL